MKPPFLLFKRIVSQLPTSTNIRRESLQCADNLFVTFVIAHIFIFIMVATSALNAFREQLIACSE